MKKSNLLMEYDVKNQIIIQHWKGFSTSEQFRELVNSSLEMSQKVKVKAIISDAKDAAIAKKEDTDWAASVVPALIANGITALAFVIPSSAFAQLSVNNFEDKASPLIQIRHFDSLERAKLWLSNMDKEQMAA